jgi:thiamine-phosphate pyrophosphorylase
MSTGLERLPRLILVTDPAYGDDAIVRTLEACARALPHGAFGVQLRDKKRPSVSLRMFASRLRLITRSAEAKLFENGDPHLARVIGADGVHLGGDAIRARDARAIVGPGAFISIAAHSDDAVRLGVADGANAALVSPIFASPGKGGGRGVDVLRSARALAPADVAIYALGGVDHGNTAACIEAGAHGVAVIRALLLADDPAAEARAIYDRIADVPS